MLFLSEAGLMGLLGGIGGAITGAGLMLAIGGNLSISLGTASTTGVLVPLIVGLLSAVYPGVIASQTAPAETMRYE